MNQTRKFPFIPILLNCILLMISNYFSIWWIPLFQIAPLLVIYYKYAKTHSLTLGLIYGLLYGGIGYAFVIPLTNTFFGELSIYSILLYLIIVISYILVFTIPNYIISKMYKWKSLNFIELTIIFTVTFTSCELLINSFFNQIPWLSSYIISRGIFSSQYLIQLASIGGIRLLDICLIIINYLIAYAYLNRKNINLLSSLGAITIFFGLNFIALKQSEKIQIIDKQKFIIQTEQILPNKKWDETYTNTLVNKLFEINDKAIELADTNDVIIWSETPLPWTYRKEDAFLEAIMKKSNAKNINNLIGLYTDGINNEKYNSVYYLEQNGNVSQYDKQELITIAEKPLQLFNKELINNYEYLMTNGPNNKPLNIHNNLYGILICSEGIIEEEARKAVKIGAKALISINNNGWFKDFERLLNHHQLSLRLRAIEQRKDIVVVNNLGYSGIIKKDGNISEMYLKENPNIQNVQCELNNQETFYYKFPYLSTLIYMISILYVITIYIKRSKI